MVHTPKLRERDLEMHMRPSPVKSILKDIQLPMLNPFQVVTVVTPVLYPHELFATMALVAVIVATLARIILVYQKTENTFYKYIPFGLSLVSVIFITITGFLGGKLVMDFMIGI